MLAACGGGAAPAVSAPPLSPGGPLGRPGAPAPPFGETGLETPAGPRCVLVAATENARERGLMGVRAIDPWAGMLFTFGGRPTRSSFYMKDTLIPLDIAFIGGDGTVQDVLTMEPCPPDVAQCPTYQPSRDYTSALEVAKGAAGALGLVAGAHVAPSDAAC